MRILFAILLVPVIAAADPAKTAEQKHEGDCAAARKAHKTCVIDMGKEELTADKPVGDGIGVGVIQTGKEPSMIHIRRDFIVEIIKSAEDLP